MSRSPRVPAAEAVPLLQVVEDALDDVLPTLKGRGVKVSVASEPPEAELVLRGDRDKLTCLARNLLDNAARYSPPGSSVQVGLVGGERATTLTVSDQGPGIPAELRERVFESYYRVPGNGGEGSGLGLAIVREIAAQHGATVVLEDADGGRGTRVRVSFPAPPAA